MLKPEVERMRALLVDAITTLCRSGLRYNCELKVEGLIGITLDEADIILVNLNKTFGSRFEEVTSSNKKLGKLDAVTTTTQTDTSQDADDDGDGEAGVEDLDTSAVIGKTETLEYPAEPASPDVSGERHKSRKRSERSGSRDSSPTSHVKRVRSNSAGAATGVQDSIQIQSSFTLQSGSEEASGESQASGSSSKAAAPITTDTDTARQVQSRLSTPEFSTPIPGRDPEKPMVKIEIDSDSDVEEVKNEPGALDSCRLRTDASLQLSQDFSQSSQAFQPADMSSFMGTNTSAHPGELYPTQLLHTDLAAGHQQELTIPASAYSSLMAPMPGPSRLTMPPHGGATSATGIPPDGQQQLEADGTPKAKGPNLLGNLSQLRYECAMGSGQVNESGCGKIEPQFNAAAVAHSLQQLVDRPADQSSGNFTCPICQKSYVHKTSLNWHMKRHDPNLFRCSYCHTHYNSQEKLKEHNLRSHSNVCMICGANFIKVKELKDHMQNAHFDADQEK